ncbi:MAG: acyl-CoA thioesterase [Fimbriimonas sp.]|nr:acyl-CoA thioesterase [Fimbriimonas sp.]
MNTGARTVSSSRTEMSEVMQPQDANFLGKVFGGSILSKIDLCAYATSARFAGTICVTASFDRVDFHEPIEVGELVTFVGHVSYVGRSSLEVTIEIYAENVMRGTKRHTNTARVTMVALRDGKTVEVPRLICESRDDKVRYLEGRLRRELRARQAEDRARIHAKFAEADDTELDRLLAADRLSE